MFLILASLPSQLVEFRRLARILRDRGEIVRLLVEHEQLLTEPGAELLPRFDGQSLPVWAKLAVMIPGSKGFSKTVSGSFVAAQREYERAAPKAVIVGEDGVGGNLAWIAAAKERNIPVIIMPYEYSGVEQAIAAIRPNLRDFLVSGLLAKIFAKLRPAWMRVIDGYEVLRLPFRYALGYELVGVAPPNPWAVHGGNAGVLLAESAQMVAHYEKEGVPLAKIAHVGSLALDDLHEAIKQAPPREGPLRILCALPPDYTIDRGPMPYRELIAVWLEEAMKYGHVTVQAHPSARESLRAIGVQFDTRDITTLIAENDLLVTSVSSIIRYALAAGRPVLNFDCYNFDYRDYDAAAGCSTVSSMCGYARMLTEISGDYEHFQRRAAPDAATWGVIDGRAADRIAAVLGLSGQATA